MITALEMVMLSCIVFLALFLGVVWAQLRVALAANEKQKRRIRLLMTRDVAEVTPDLVATPITVPVIVNEPQPSAVVETFSGSVFEPVDTAETQTQVFAQPFFLDDFGENQTVVHPRPLSAATDEDRARLVLEALNRDA